MTRSLVFPVLSRLRFAGLFGNSGTVRIEEVSFDSDSLNVRAYGWISGLVKCLCEVAFVVQAFPKSAI